MLLSRYRERQLKISKSVQSLENYLTVTLILNYMNFKTIEVGGVYRIRVSVGRCGTHKANLYFSNYTIL